LLSKNLKKFKRQCIQMTLQFNAEHVRFRPRAFTRREDRRDHVIRLFKQKL